MEKKEENGWGGKREGSGRKMLYAGGRRQLAISLSQAQKDAIVQAAEKAGMTVAAYVLEKCGVAGLK